MSFIITIIKTLKIEKKYKIKYKRSVYTRNSLTHPSTLSFIFWGKNKLK